MTHDIMDYKNDYEQYLFDCKCIFYNELYERKYNKKLSQDDLFCLIKTGKKKDGSGLVFSWTEENENAAKKLWEAMYE